ncbi:hypothetical protein AG1IA_00139 [Rhizoctonia solani AG-1 IA]|uniref:Uncharacterized protein n=1 Tax=Thanatephorus cucumeris (strain AG1-IA) TaxID=983506 RepID=L8X9R4_THACA|nr:hypothetical protein AG1IA_00139 [Rhizoctonia solani AG-1 IA]
MYFVNRTFAVHTYPLCCSAGQTFFAFLFSLFTMRLANGSPLVVPGANLNQFNFVQKEVCAQSYWLLWAH